MKQYLNQRKILFITTKNLDYIRNRQEINLLKKYASSCHVIGSTNSSYFFRLLKVYLTLLNTPLSAYDTVFVGFAPQLILPVFHWKLKKKYIIEDFFISMYDTLCYDRQKIKPDSCLGRLLHYIDCKTLTQADLILCDTNAHGQYFVSEFHAAAASLRTLYLKADTAVYHPMDASRPAALLDKYIVLYFGSILPLQGADIVVQAMERLQKDDRFHFYFIGPVKKIDKTLAKLHPVNPEKTSNIEYINYLPQAELARYIDYADLCLAGHFNAQIAKASRTIPGKAYIYHAMQKPMILGDNPANRERFSSDPLTTFVKMGDSQALADTILQKMQEVNSLNPPCPYH